MTRKHFEAIAKILNAYTLDNRPHSMFQQERLDIFVEDLADFFQQSNSNFDRERFFGAITEYGKNWD